MLGYISLFCATVGTIYGCFGNAHGVWGAVGGYLLGLGWYAWNSYRYDRRAYDYQGETARTEYRKAA